MISRSTDVRSALRSRQRGFLLNPARFGGGGGADPHFANVVLLLHMNGADGSTTFTDSSASAKTPALVAGNAQISTAQSKFGGSSGLFDGAGDYISYASHADFGFGTGDFTVEGWIYQTNLAVDQCLFDTRASGKVGMAIYSSGSAASRPGRLQYANDASIIAGTGSTPFTASAWNHWAVCRSANTVRGFINGVLVWSVTDSRTHSASNSAFVGSNYVPGQYHNGSLDDVRVTKGVARYTANFTPPTAEFPNS